MPSTPVERPRDPGGRDNLDRRLFPVFRDDIPRSQGCRAGDTGDINNKGVRQRRWSGWAGEEWVGRGDVCLWLVRSM